MKLSLLAAVAENGVIGRDGALPWRLPADLARVKRLTTGHCILMGRKTYDSIGRPLPNRTNIVITRDPAWKADGVVVVHGVDQALAVAREQGETEAFVLGGQAVYEATLPRADRLYLTRVHARVPGDTRFPSLADVDAGRGWRLLAQERHPRDERHEHAFTFQDYERTREAAPD